MKIQKGHYVPKELITSEAIHEAVVKCFVAAVFSDGRPLFGKQGEYGASHFGLGIFDDGCICWLTSGSAEEPLTLQQLFTAENGLQWPDWAHYIVCNDFSVYFSEDATDGKFEFIHGCTYGKPVVLATRQPKEKEVNEALDKAVIGLKGKWPSSGCSYMQSFESEKEYGLNNYNAEGTFCTRDQFTQRAKELGFINGYRWGIEYPTNGKRPDLDDDVVVCIDGGCSASSGDSVDGWNWNKIKSFRITDQRYKPADTGYLQTLTVEAIEEVVSWYDYENQKALRLPPVGVDCYRKIGINWIKTSIVAHHHDGVRAIFCDEGFSIGELGYTAEVMFKPIDHASRKAELEKKSAVDAAMAEVDEFIEPRQTIEALYELGWRPTK